MKSNLIIVSLMILSFGLLKQNSFAQCGPVGHGTNGAVFCMYNDSNAIHDFLYVGGGFHTSGNDTLNNCGYWNDTTFHHMGMNDWGTNDSVHCLTQFNNHLYAGGSFTQAGGILANYIARWDGNGWQPVGNGFNSPVYTLTVYNNQLYAGGAFTSSGSTTTNHIAYWNGSQWMQVAGGLNDAVKTMCVGNSSLYIGGDFTNAGALTVNRICMWDGSNFSTLGTGFTTTSSGHSCRVHSLCIYNGHLYVGGTFEHVNNTDMHNIAMWNGSSWVAIGDIEGSSHGENAVNAFCVYDNHLYVGGNFGSCDGHSSSNIGCWNGNQWTTIGTGMNAEVQSLAVHKNKLYLGGSFTLADGTTVSNIAQYSTSTGIQSLENYHNGLTIYPNPVTINTVFNWKQSGSGPTLLSIFNQEGKMVFQENLGERSSGFQTHHISFENWTAGIYFASISNGIERVIRKFNVIK